MALVKQQPPTIMDMSLKTRDYGEWTSHIIQSVSGHLEIIQFYIVVFCVAHTDAFVIVCPHFG